MSGNILSSSEALALLGIFLGIVAKAFSPYLRKSIIDNEPLKWEHRYTAIIIMCAITSILTFPQYSPPPDGLNVLVAAFSFGIAIEWGVTELYQWGASAYNSLTKKNGES